MAFSCHVEFQNGYRADSIYLLHPDTLGNMSGNVLHLRWPAFMFMFLIFFSFVNVEKLGVPQYPLNLDSC